MRNFLVLSEVRARAPRWFLGLVALLAIALSPSANAAESADPATWRVWMDAKFMRAPSAQLIPGAERTVLVPGRLVEGELKAFNAEEWKTLGVTWEDFLKRARENAATELAALKPQYERDRKKVIDHAMIRSEEPIVNSVVLSPKFLALFQDTLGPKVLVVVPNRFTAYVFPRLVSSYREYSPGVFEDYRATAHPVSVEVFELSDAGLRAIGAYEEP